MGRPGIWAEVVTRRPGPTKSLQSSGFRHRSLLAFGIWSSSLGSTSDPAIEETDGHQVESVRKTGFLAGGLLSKNCARKRTHPATSGLLCTNEDQMTNEEVAIHERIF